jgi:TRAP-type C4-dicarboxylate transport system substrate-binding protein
MGYPDLDAIPAVHGKLWEEFGDEMMKEFKGMKPMGLRAMVGRHLFTTDRQVIVPDDIKGLRILSSGGSTDMLEAVGAVPVFSLPPDWYTNLERGLGDGHEIHWAAMGAFKLIDLCDFGLLFGEAGESSTLDTYLWNLETWNSLPPDIQEIIEEATLIRIEEENKLEAEEVRAGIEYAKEVGMTIHTTSPEELKLWQDATKPVHAKWVTETTKLGYPAQEIYDAAVRLIEEINAAR